MRKKVFILVTVTVFVAISLAGCTLRNANVKIGEATTDKNVTNSAPMKLVD